MNYFFYRILTTLLAPVFLGYTLFRAKKDGGMLYIKQRLGFAFPEIKQPVWLHCASVGEVHAAWPLIQCLQSEMPNTALLVSTNTPTGKQALLLKSGDKVSHAYLPLDYKIPVQRLIEHVQPRLIVVMETEIWPVFYQAAASEKIPLIIINARLTDRTLNAAKWMRKTYQQALKSSAGIYCRNQTDERNYRQLADSSENISMIGNIKFSQPINGEQAAENLLGVKYCLAASTHEDEELQIVRQWIKLENPPLLVIAPRYPEKSDKICQQFISLGLDVSVRSKNEPITETTNIYIADTFGEMAALYQYSELVIMGGSFIPRGGHNILEPAKVGCAIICGPYMDNFSEELALFLKQEAIEQLSESDQLVNSLRNLFNNPSARKIMGNNAKQLIEENEDVAGRYCALVMSHNSF